MKNQETFEKVLSYLKENNSDEQIFNSRNIVGDNMGTIIDENGIELLHCGDWEYYEVIGLTDEQEEQFKAALSELDFAIEF